MDREKILLVSNDIEMLETVYINYVGNYTITGILSQSIKCPQFMGIPVYSFENFKITDFTVDFIVIADEKNMLTFVRIFRKMNLNLIDDWVPYWLFETNEIDTWKLYQYVGTDPDRFINAIKELRKKKELIVLFGNCQTIALSYYLKYNREFCERYYLLKMPQIWWSQNIDKYKIFFSLGLYSYIDILCIQDISKNNNISPILALDNILGLISKNCRVIMITKCWSRCYYPQYIGKKQINYHLYANKEALKKFNNLIDYNVAYFIQEGKKIEEILNIVCSDNLYTKREIMNSFWDELAESKRREENCDLRICDYLEEKAGSEVLFEAVRHPAETVLVEMSERLLGLLNIQNRTCFIDSGIHSWGISDEFRLPIYPSVIKSFGLDEKYKYLLYRLPSGKKVPFREYMETYIRMVFGVNGDRK